MNQLSTNSQPGTGTGIKQDHYGINARSCGISSDLHALVRMGFARDRAEKALAWTGDVGLGAAIDWILAHRDDPFLDRQERREYLVYLCPSGPLLDQIQAFLDRTAHECGRNGAHLHLTHITMCHGFKADDRKVPVILKVLRESFDKFADRLPTKMALERYMSDNFMGLFLDNHSEKILKEYSQHLVGQLQKHCEQEIPINSKKAFHLTLAYHFERGDYETLLNLSKRIDLKATAKWHFRLYSRDPRFNAHEVFQVSRPWHPSAEYGDQLALTPGDFLYVAPKDKEAVSGTPVGYVSGYSWTCGSAGIAPTTHLCKCFDSDVWILHESIQCCPALAENTLVSNRIDMWQYPPAQRIRWLQHGTHGPHGAHGDKGSSLLMMGPSMSSPSKETCAIYVMRHGERMDFVFGWEWIRKCFDAHGNFTRSDLNMPKAVPKRQAGSGAAAYIRDPPLTSVGLLQAQITGKAMNEAGVIFSRIFASPALRCVQTATAVLETCSDPKNVKLCLEPGLYEWLGWVKEDHPEWLSPSELHSIGIPIDLEYRPFASVASLNYEETVEQYYARNGITVQKALDQYGHEGGNMLFVAHASSLDTCTRLLVGQSPRNQLDMNKVCQRVPYCGVVMCCCEGANKTWTLRNPPFPPLTHGANVQFNAVGTFVSAVDRINHT